MIAVHHDQVGGVEKFDATGAAVTADGALVLTRISVRQGIDPATMRPRLETSNPQLVSILAAGTWLRADNLDLDETPEEG